MKKMSLSKVISGKMTEACLQGHGAGSWMNPTFIVVQLSINIIIAVFLVHGASCLEVHLRMLGSYVNSTALLQEHRR